MILKLWTRDVERIKLLQSELNQYFVNDYPKLKVDGIFGNKTREKVMKFQRSRPAGFVINGVFDPETQAEFKKVFPNSKLVGSTSVAKTEQIKFQSELQEVFTSEGKSNEWNTFIDAVEQAAVPEMKKILLGIQLAETARYTARVYLLLKSWGFTAKEIGVVFRQLYILKTLNGGEFETVVKAFSSPNSPFGKFLKTAGPIATKMGLIVTFIECLIHAKKGNYAAIFAEIYKFVMGKWLPWAGFIDNLQTFVELVIPKSWQLNVVFKVLKVANPIGVGAVGVEAIAASTTATYHFIMARGDFGATIPRLDKLVQRMKTSPLSGLAELGDNAGDSAYQLYRMSSTEWGLIMSYKWRQFKNLF